MKVCEGFSVITDPNVIRFGQLQWRQKFIDFIGDSARQLSVSLDVISVIFAAVVLGVVVDFSDRLPFKRKTEMHYPRFRI